MREKTEAQDGILSERTVKLLMRMISNITWRVFFLRFTCKEKQVVVALPRRLPCRHHREEVLGGWVVRC